MIKDRSYEELLRYAWRFQKAGQGKHIYVGSGDTVVLTNTCGHEVTIRAHSAAHLEIG